MWNLIVILSLFASAFSQHLVNTANNCGGILTGISGSILSPNFDIGENYPANTYCQWEITVPENKRIQFSFTAIDVEYAPPDCTFDGVVMHDVTEGFTLNVTNVQQTSRYIGKTRFCGDLPFDNVTSKTNKVVVAFYSDDDTEAGGFSITWTAVNIPKAQFDCDFENGLCEGWEDMGFPNDHFDWEFQKRGTRTSLTGPSFDHTMQNENGQYAFIEASLPRRPNEEAILVTPPQSFNASMGDMCLRFWYHMYGGDIGTLRVAILVGKTSTISWFKTGEQGQNWMEGRLTIPHQYEPFQIMFIGIRGRGHQGDIALDDVTFADGSCAQISTQVTPDLGSVSSSVTTTTRPPISCNQFEYACVSGFSCIPKFYLCDGMMDCPDNDDEDNCDDFNDILPPILTDDVTTAGTPNNVTSSATTSQPAATTPPVPGCPDDYVPCIDGHCIPVFWLCDGEKDCGDAGDEKNCSTDGETATTGWVDYGVYDNFTDEMIVDGSTTQQQTTTQTVLVTETTETATEHPSTSPPTTVETTTEALTTSTAATTAFSETTTTTTEEPSTTETAQSSTETAQSSTETAQSSTETAQSSTETAQSSTEMQTQRSSTESTTNQQTTHDVDVSATSRPDDTTTEAITTTTTASSTTTSAPQTTSVDDVKTETDVTTSDVTTSEKATFTPRPAATTTTTRKPVSTPKLLTRDTKAPARLGGDEGGASSVRSQSLFVLLLQTLATLFVAMALSAWR